MSFDFPLPEGWCWKTIDQIKAPGRSIVSGPFGSNIGMRFFVEKGVPVIRGNNLSLSMERFRDDGFVFLTDEKASEFKNCEAHSNDLIFTAAGTIGQVGIIPSNSRFPTYIISNKQLRARLDPEVVHPLFAYYWLASPLMVELIKSRNTGSTIPLINLSVLRSLPIPLPPLAMQAQIVHVLSLLDERVLNLTANNLTLQAIAQALFKSWFVDFDPVRAKQEGREPEGMDAATAALFPDRSATRLARRSDLILCVRGSTTGRRVVSDGEYCIGRGVCSIRPHNNQCAFVYQTLDFHLDRLLSKTTGSVFPNLSSMDIKSFQILKPADSVMEAYQCTAGPLVDRINQNHKLIGTLSRLRDTLLPRLISGQLRLPDAEALVEEAAA